MSQTPSIHLSATNLGSLLHEAAHRFAPRPAFTQIAPGGEEASLSYREFDELSRAFAAFLRTECGLREGDSLVVVLQNVLAFPICLAGAWSTGVTVVPLASTISDEDVCTAIRECGAKAVVGCRQRADDFKQIQLRTGVGSVILAGPADLFPWLKGLKVHGRLFAAGMFPRGSSSSVSFVSALKRGKKALRNSTESMGVQPETAAIITFAEEGTPDRGGVVATHRQLLAELEQTREGLGLPLVPGKETVLTPAPLHHPFAVSINFLLFFAVGANNVMLQNLRDMSLLRRALQRHSVSVIAASGHLVSLMALEGWFGEKLLRRLKAVVFGVTSLNQRARGIWKAATNAGFFPVGGFVEATETLNIPAGETLFPEEVEQCIEEMPSVRECAISLISPMEGAARLHVSLVPRSHDEVPSLEEVRAHCRQSLASYKIPGTIDVVWSLPRTSFGRLQRSEIQAQAAERMRLYDLEHRLGEYQKRREGETPTAPEIHQV